MATAANRKRGRDVDHVDEGEVVPGAASDNDAPLFSQETLKRTRLDDLKELCRKYTLPVTGTKKVLMERLGKPPSAGGPSEERLLRPVGGACELAPYEMLGEHQIQNGPLLTLAKTLGERCRLGSVQDQKDMVRAFIVAHQSYFDALCAVRSSAAGDTVSAKDRSAAYERCFKALLALVERRILLIMNTRFPYVTRMFRENAYWFPMDGLTFANYKAAMAYQYRALLCAVARQDHVPEERLHKHLYQMIKSAQDNHIHFETLSDVEVAAWGPPTTKGQVPSLDDSAVGSALTTPARKDAASATTSPAAAPAVAVAAGVAAPGPAEPVMASETAAAIAAPAQATAAAPKTPIRPSAGAARAAAASASTDPLDYLHRPELQGIELVLELARDTYTLRELPSMRCKAVYFMGVCDIQPMLDDDDSSEFDDTDDDDDRGKYYF